MAPYMPALYCWLFRCLPRERMFTETQGSFWLDFRNPFFFSMKSNPKLLPKDVYENHSTVASSRLCVCRSYQNATFFRWALLTVSCYRSITHLSGENYFTATMLEVIVKHQCLFPLKCRVSRINASFQTEQFAAGEISTRQLPEAGRQQLQEKVLSFSQVFHCQRLWRIQNKAVDWPVTIFYFFFNSRFFPLSWGHKDEAEKVRFTPADESSKPLGTKSFKIISCQIFFETFDISFGTVCLYC